MERKFEITTNNYGLGFQSFISKMKILSYNACATFVGWKILFLALNENNFSGIIIDIIASHTDWISG